MHKEKILEIASEMLATLKGGVSHDEVLKAREVDEAKAHATKREKISHLMFMCEEVPRLIGQHNIERAKEYIDFVQGALWALFPISLRALRSIKTA